ncbi:hypothetical protein QNO00_05120 [Arthrobacter sp. zg-Y1219]|uniref:hypothetical protein n=1 Tax=Arthrobacter sp. zg-Y1219 TaxID=3049067 RepID=UPI0024C22050|nr:hypothetical protein [Arthrobacter sp. zg-Y1219]MDK1359646.1 hypothetical protein [Arthrobacter sp. zg-Y1219]
MVKERAYDPTDKAQVFRALRQEILAARLKVTLDEELGRETSPEVLSLSKMKVPPIARPQHLACDTQAGGTETGTKDD